MKNKVLVLASFLSMAPAFANEFIMGLDSKIKGDVVIEATLEIKSETCIDILWPSFKPEGGLREMIPFPVPATKKFTQTQVINDDVAEFKWDYAPGFCRYAPSNVSLRLSYGEKKEFYSIYSFKSDTSNVVLEIPNKKMGNVFWRQWRATPYAPQVFVEVQE